MIRVLIVDDHAVVRRGLEQLISSAPDLEIVGAAMDGEEAVRMSVELTPDVILMDLSMPVLDGIEATRQIVAARPDVHVVVLTSFDDQRRILDALGAGATGYLLKDAEPDEVLSAIRTAVEGGSPLDPRAARGQALRFLPGGQPFHLLPQAERSLPPAATAPEAVPAAEPAAVDALGVDSHETSMPVPATARVVRGA